MFTKSNFLNYITILFAISTVVSCIVFAHDKSKYFICLLLLSITLISRELSKNK